MSVTDKSNLINKDTSSERQLLDQSITEEGSNKVKKVELEIETESEKEASIPPPENEVGKRVDVLMPFLTHLHLFSGLVLCGMSERHILLYLIYLYVLNKLKLSVWYVFSDFLEYHGLRNNPTDSIYIYLISEQIHFFVCLPTSEILSNILPQTFIMVRCWLSQFFFPRQSMCGHFSPFQFLFHVWVSYS
jgi:hypothetical protein